MGKTAIVILNYNGVDFLKRFLGNVVDNSPNCEVIVADNCSTDDSIVYLNRHHPTVRILAIEENKGYSGGYNMALQQIDAKYYVLLNSDVLVTLGWTEPIISLMDDNPQIAACQPKILSYSDKEYFEYAGAAGGFIDSLGYPFCRGRIFLDLEKDEGQFDDICQVFWATGACLFVRATAFNEVGQLDEDFFAHMEEIDLCWRFNNAGYSVMYNGHSRVYHVGGGTLSKTNPKKTYLNFRNGLSLIYKNYDKSELFFKFPIRLVLDWIAALKFTLFDSVGDGKAVLKAHSDFFKNVSRNRKKRRETQARKRVKKLKVIYSGSIVLQYYLGRRKKFKKLKNKGLELNSSKQNTSSAANAF